MAAFKKENVIPEVKDEFWSGPWQMSNMTDGSIITGKHGMTMLRFDDVSDAYEFAECLKKLIDETTAPEENKMIDWSKPIETSNGNFASFVRERDGRYFCALHENDHIEYDLFLAEFNEDGTHVKGKGHVSVRNKPELIKPQGWLVIVSDGKRISWFTDDPSALRTNDKHIIVSMEDLMSGKFKDGIPKGYTSS